MNARLVLVSAAVATVLTIVIAAVIPGARTALDLRVYDVMLRASAGRPPSDAVALVVVDDASIAEIGQWPWPRDVLSRLVDSLHVAGAAALAVDVLLSEPDRLGEPMPGDSSGTGLTRTDAQLIRALEAAPVAMGHAFTFGDGARMDTDACGLNPLGVVVLQPPGRASPLDDLPHPTGSVCGLRAFTEAAGAAGFLNAEPDPDGVLRRVPLLMARDGQVYPSLALAAVVAAGEADDLVLEPGPGERLLLDLGGFSVPLDRGGSLLARYWGGVGTFTEIHASDVLRGRMPEGSLRGRIVFVGATALGLRDVVATPFASSVPGIEVHATIAGNMLERDLLEIPSWAGSVTLGGIVSGSLGAAVLTALFGLLAGSLMAVVVTMLSWFLAASGVSGAGVFVSPVLPSVAVAIAVLAMTVLRLRHEGWRADRERSRRERTSEFTIESLTSLIETRDASTGEHVRRTREYAGILASELAGEPAFRAFLTPETLDAIRQLAPLHDIGKVGVRDAILRKPGPLTDDEYDLMKRHPELGFQTLVRAEEASGMTSPRDQEIMRVAKDLVYTHHERWDGEGYPRGLAGEEIPIPGRIMALVDAYDAMTEARVYRKALSHEEARDFIVMSRGTRYQPAVVDAFLRVEEAFRRISQRGREGEAPRSETVVH